MASERAQTLTRNCDESVRLLRPRDCATALGVSLTTLWRWAKSGDFPAAYRIGPKAIAYDEREINAWLGGRRVQPDAMERSAQ